MAGELVPLVSPTTPAIRLVGAGIVYSVDNPYLRDGLLAAGEMLVYDDDPYKVVRQDRRLIGRPANDNWVTTEVTYEQDNPGRVFRVGDQLTLGPLQSVYMRPTNRGIIAGAPGKSYAAVRFDGAGNVGLMYHSENESLVLGDAVKMAAFVAVAMYAAPYVVTAVEATGAAIFSTPVSVEPAFVGPIESPGIVGPFVPAGGIPTVVSDVAPTLAPITAAPATTTATQWTLAEVTAAAKTTVQTAGAVVSAAKAVASAAPQVTTAARAIGALTPDQIRAAADAAGKAGGVADQFSNLTKNPIAMATAGILFLLMVS